MLLDCARLEHWDAEAGFREMFRFERDYQPWICLKLEEADGVLVLELEDGVPLPEPLDDPGAHAHRSKVGCLPNSPAAVARKRGVARTAPCRAVLRTVAPTARQRRTTLSRGKPQRFAWPAETMASSGLTESTKGTLEDVALP